MNFDRPGMKITQFFANVFGRQDASNQKKEDNPDVVGAYATGLQQDLGGKKGRGNKAISDASRYPEKIPDIDEDNIKSSFKDYISGKGTLFNQENNNWKSFAIESISYSVLVLVIGIIGGNLESISNLTDPDKKGNSYLLRNKFEGLFKHSLSANSQLKIDESVYKDSSIPVDLRVWCSLCDLSVQAKLLLQSWPLKIFDYGNWAMCELTWNAFDNIFTKGKAFKAYFIPIFLIVIIYFQIPLIIGFLVALLGSSFHPNFPLYWLGVFAYLSYIKSIVRPIFKFILGGNCTRLLAQPDTDYIKQKIVTTPITAHEIELFNSLDEMDEDGSILKNEHNLNHSKRRAIGKLLEIIKSTPCTFDKAYKINGNETTITNANCIDMNINFSVGSFFWYGKDGKTDIRSFKDLAANLISQDSFLYLVNGDDEGGSAAVAEAAGAGLHHFLPWSDYEANRRKILGRRKARRSKQDKFKYYVNPMCVADVAYVDDNFSKTQGSPLWDPDVKYWLWSKTEWSDRERMYNKLREEIEDDPYGYFRGISRHDGSGKPNLGKKRALEIIDLIERKDKEWNDDDDFVPIVYPPAAATKYASAINAPLGTTNGVSLGALAHDTIRRTTYDFNATEYALGKSDYDDRASAQTTLDGTAGDVGKIDLRINRLRGKLRKKIKTNKVHRGIIMAMIRLSALSFIIYKAFDIGYSKHLYVDNPKKQERIEAEAAAAAAAAGGAERTSSSSTRSASRSS